MNFLSWKDYKDKNKKEYCIRLIDKRYKTNDYTASIFLECSNLEEAKSIYKTFENDKLMNVSIVHNLVYEK